jgi:tripartite-type tricarboxylate transporter receptor subunit TctC
MPASLDFSRRKFLHAALAAPALAAAPSVGHAQTYPTRPIHLVVGQAAGTAPDIIARLLAQWLGQRLGQSIMVENRPGAGTNVATESVVRAPPDGYTLLLSSMTNAINATLYPHLPFDFVRDIAPVTFVSDNPFVMVVTPSFPANNVAEFIAYAKANPGKVNMASGGNGSAPHVFGELFKLMAGVDLTHVPYRTSLYPDLLAGRVQLAFTAIAGSLAFIKAGKLRVLAVTTTRPSALLPDVPPLSRFVPGYEASAWLGVGAPNGTPVAIVEQLNKDINTVIADPSNKARLTALGVEPVPMSPAAFGAFTDKETQKWAKVIASANIKVD